MRPYFVELLNRLFGTEVFNYLVPNGVMLIALGALMGTVWAAREARRRGLDPDAVYGLALWAIPSAIAGARLMSLFTAPEIYGGSLSAFLDPLRGTSVAYGGYLAGAAAAIAYLRRRSAQVWRYLDCVAPGVGLGTFCGRLGCFLDGDDFGSLTDSPLAVRFPAGSLAHLAQLDAGLLSKSAESSLPVHPVQLYLAAAGLLLAAIAACWGRRRRVAPGEAFALFWLLYGVTRFLLEFLRGDVSRGFPGALNTSQVVSIPVALVGALFLWRRRRCRTQ